MMLLKLISNIKLILRKAFVLEPKALWPATKEVHQNLRLQQNRREFEVRKRSPSKSVK